ncbi:helix-turn-helix domain-containing protein [Rhizobium sp. BK176]|uniref:helix-turn-helix domain-containing protein n=1 Tax=Rhizobium sp. BK176 TaxID=2587071 RepID=UPI002167580F|nr:helix-turn-helix transcriptional regulator [Rhizobium sp. BK176]MCS4088940.1 transcriptional regulator with XRE-family HTH domain [Rhizobium sp. BK176]
MNLRTARSAANLSQAKLAKLSGVNQQYIGRIEKGKVDSPHYLPAIAAALGIPVSTLDPTYEDRNPASSPGSAATLANANRVAEDLRDSGVSHEEISGLVQSVISLSARLESELGFRPTLTQSYQYLLKRAGI